jgi:hypothetical protein
MRNEKENRTRDERKKKQERASWNKDKQGDPTRECKVLVERGEKR